MVVLVQKLGVLNDEVTLKVRNSYSAWNGGGK